jgi:hypothetical protein
MILTTNHEEIQHTEYDLYFFCRGTLASSHLSAVYPFPFSEIHSQSLTE